MAGELKCRSTEFLVFCVMFTATVTYKFNVWSFYYHRQQQDQLPENSHLKNMSISGFNASFAAHSALQHRRNSKPYVKSSVDARRRSFDVTIIIKETSFSSCRAEDSIMDRRRHSVIA